VKPRTLSLIFTNAIVGTAVLISAFIGNPWAAAVFALLFVFTAFPWWRGKIAKLVESLIHLAAKMQKGAPNDRCDSE
jgi:hypothetical protein